MSDASREQAAEAVTTLATGLRASVDEALAAPTFRASTHGSPRRPARRACNATAWELKAMDSFFTVKIASSDDFDVPSLSAQDVKNALLAKAVDEDVPVEEVSVEAWVKVQA